MRGEACFEMQVRTSAGITPACAGRSVLPLSVCRRPGDHPRVCGEKPEQQGLTQGQQGSPPRVRGEAKCRCGPVELPGITPACAGRRTQSYGEKVTSRDHPRVCGEKAIGALWVILSAGSPPRVRGEVGKRFSKCCPRGITPACAGRRSSARSELPRPGDHPRVCGEKAGGHRAHEARWGSPPRVRGEEMARVYRPNT